MNTEKINYIKDRFFIKYPNLNQTDFESALSMFYDIKPFAPDGNIFDEQTINNEAHFIMRTAVQYSIREAFIDMKIDLTDDNVSEDLALGNISTAGRIAKVWCGSNINDDRELGGGRWSKKPRLASFPNTGNKTIPITKRIDIVSNCSHHNIVFSTLTKPDSYAIISYIPDNYVLGISKLQRVADWVSQRFWLQENLTKALYDEVVKVAETESVFVRISDAVHGCESFRGSKSSDGSFTSEYYGGAFEDINIRNSVIP